MAARAFEVVVIGGGTAGLAAALAADHAGARTLLVEREPRLGGECTFSACVPSKALLEAARLAHETRRGAEEGLLAAAPAIDFRAVMRRVRGVVEAIAADEPDERFTRAGIEVVHASARFTGAHALAVGGGTVTAERFVVATGSRPALPPLPGLDAVPFLTNETVFELERLPARLLVLGGGPEGLELAQAFRRLGSNVGVVERSGTLLPRDEPEAGALLAGVLREEGVDLRLGARASSVRREGDDVVLALADGELRGDALLVATGRRAAVAGLALDVPGVVLEGGAVAIDERCRTSAGHVFAAGDVTGGLRFTHLAAHQGRVAGLAAAGERARRDERVLPWVTFTDPEVAHVGLTEAQARERLGGVEVVSFPMEAVDRARIAGSPRGFVKLVTARRRLLGRAGGGRLVGAQVVGPRAGELIGECALALRTRCFSGRLAQTVHAYPTLGMAIQQAAAQLFPLGRALAPPGDEGGRDA